MATPKDLPRDVGEFIRDLRHNARISLRQLADQAGVSNPYLSQIERGLRKPSAEVLQQLASALRVSTPVMYLRAGLLDAEGQPGVLSAIAADADLTIAQKQSLTQIYETFRGENARNAAPDAVVEDAVLSQSTTPITATTATAPAEDPVPPRPPAVPPGEAARQAAAVLDAVATVEGGAAPAPTPAAAGDTPPQATPRTAKKATRRVARKAAAAAEEEKS
ncbi:MAG TPA: helix-turn-helix transcriptional regulator [Catenuloplanes sp.]